jgi:hypothetical protein
MSGLHRPTLVVASALLMASGLVVLGPGCTVLTNDGLPLDAMVYDGSPESGTPACTACVTQECTGVWAVCLLDKGCQAIHACAGATGCGADCRTSCACSGSASDSGVDAGSGIDAVGAYAAFASCNDSRTCGTACKSDCTQECASGNPTSAAGSCGGDAGVDAAKDSGTTDAGDPDAGDGSTTADGGADAEAPVVVSVDGCASCVAGKCSDPKKLCALGSECASFLACAKACSDAACAEECGRQHATGKVAAVELANCTTAACKTACGF